MNNTCPTTPYGKKQSPYGAIVSPLASKSNPYSDKESMLGNIPSPLSENNFCPTDFLLADNGGYLLTNNGFRIIL
jgi:hypothetical protein